MSMRDIRTMSDVPRWTVLRTIQKQTVADHSFYVALYTKMILNTLDFDGCGAQIVIQLKLDAINQALIHDLSETFTSDIPGPVKHTFDSDAFKDYEEKGVENRFCSSLLECESCFTIKHLELVECIIKLADVLDQAAFLTSETRLGNLNVSKMENHARSMVEQQIRLVAIKFAEFMASDGHPGYNKVLDSTTAALKILADRIMNDEHKTPTLPG